MFMTTITEQNKHTWCVNAEHSLTGGNSGTTKVCCMYKSAESSNITLRTHSIQDNYNQEEVLELRSALGNGVQHPNCTACWQEENSGRESKRIRDNKKYLKLSTPYEGLAKVELNLGNVCNIKCRTCNVYASSQWMREQFDLYEKDKYINFKEYADKHKVLHQTYDEDSPFWNDLIDNLSSIKQFDFYGGEPFMSNKMWHILDIAVEQGYAKDIELHYNTNGTLWPEDKVQLWKHFKEVNISFSIDGIGNQFEYMRHMAKWNMVKDNMAKARAIQQEFKNMNISWCVTLSNLNIYNLPEVLDEFYANYSYFGLYLNLVHIIQHKEFACFEMVTLLCLFFFLLFIKTTPVF